jgi:2,3,4,5-tetrahydropyridine-2-carboxylate N-succinyltransferase
MSDLQKTIEKYFAELQTIDLDSPPKDLLFALEEVIFGLDSGSLRVAEKKNGEWTVNQWLKKAVLTSFKLNKNSVIDSGYCQFYDKVPLKFNDLSASEYQNLAVRVVPNAIVRKGAFVGKNTVLMPSYTNIGAYIDEGCMIDTWATVGSCAQIGKNVHLSGGAGIGGVLEPLQSNPTIIEDNCFIGARSEIVEGVIVERDSVISMGVYIGQSTKIYNRQTGEVTYGRIPQGSVVVSGNLPSSDGKYSLYCAVIVKQVDAQTRSKVSINELLRGF